MTGVNLYAMTEATQRACDDASHDHLYVVEGLTTAPSGALGCRLDHDSDGTDQRRLQALAYAATQAVIMHPANGGVGRGFVRFMRTETGGVEVHWSFMSGGRAAFEWAAEEAG